MIPMIAMESMAPFLPHFLLMKGAAMQPSMILVEEARVSSAESVGALKRTQPCPSQYRYWSRLQKAT